MGDMMAKRRAFLDIIKEKGALVLDGGLGSELERYGCNLQHKLWSAKILMDQPDIIKKYISRTWRLGQISFKVLDIKQQ